MHGTYDVKTPINQYFLLIMKYSESKHTCSGGQKKFDTLVDVIDDQLVKQLLTMTVRITIA